VAFDKVPVRAITIWPLIAARTGSDNRIYLKKLERMDLLDSELTMKDLGSVLRSCTRLVKLCLKAMEMSLERNFVDPVNWSNVILSGFCKGFENVKKEIDPQQRYCEHLTLMLGKK